VTWAEVIQKLKAAGYIEVRSGKGSHRLFKHSTTGKEIWIAVHTKKDAGAVGQPDSPRGRDSMKTYYPIVIEMETTGALSAYVPGLPVYAAADTRTKVEQAIRQTLAAYLEAHPDSVPTSDVRVARVSAGRRSRVHIVGVGALLGAGRSRRKARASQMNGRLGGRPRKTV
jgi:predicted RNA binding protein YcfA (HicA-like mRNA interferase family)/predicted RNase H-like HicB family nuclease